MMFVHMGDEHVFDLVVIGNVDWLLSVLIELVDVCTIGQQYSYRSIPAIGSSLMKGGLAFVL